MFAQRCSSVRNRPQPFADDRGEGAIAVSLGEAHKILNLNVRNLFLEVDFIANGMRLLRFVTCVVIACAFCVAGAIL